MSERHIDEALIKKYLAGHANESEKNLVEQFMLQDGAKEMFDQVWEELHPEMNAPATLQVSNPNRMESWKSVIRQKIEQASQRSSEIVGGSRTLLFKQVAIWTIILLCGALWGTSQFVNRKNLTEIEWITHTNPNGQKSVIRLSDSTMVYLGAGSSLAYPKRFKGDTREVKLEGEAFFEVTKDTEKQFLVFTDELVTRVLGTSFKVASFPGLPINVSVSTGHVQVTQASDTKEKVYVLADLTAGQQVVWNKQTGVTKTDSGALSSAGDFMGGKLVFEDSPLLEIAKTLERNYNVKVEIQQEALSNQHIRITLEKDLALKQVMEVLAASGGFSYALERGLVKIY